MSRHNGFRAVPLLACLLTAGCSNFCYGVSVERGKGGTGASAIPAPPDVAAPPADAVRTPSGLASKVLTPGTGTRHPRPNSEVTVHYTGWTTGGEMFDSSVARGEPSTFSLDGVIAGWTEGVQMMVVGEKRRFWIPARLAYEGVPDRPQGTLVFDIELLKMN
jgi:FKBP-type peptidyl-prolyl cis-trans isomerase